MKIPINPNILLGKDGSNFFKYNIIGENSLVKLRPISNEDITTFRKFASDERIWKYFPHKIHTFQDMEIMLKKQLSREN